MGRSYDLAQNDATAMLYGEIFATVERSARIIKSDILDLNEIVRRVYVIRQSKIGLESREPERPSPSLVPIDQIAEAGKLLATAEEPTMLLTEHDPAPGIPADGNPGLIIEHRDSDIVVDRQVLGPVRLAEEHRSTEIGWRCVNCRSPRIWLDETEDARDRPHASRDMPNVTRVLDLGLPQRQEPGPLRPRALYRVGEIDPVGVDRRDLDHLVVERIAPGQDRVAGLELPVGRAEIDPVGHPGDKGRSRPGDVPVERCVDVERGKTVLKQVPERPLAPAEQKIGLDRPPGRIT
jgi:hypothetical protein